MNIHLTTNGQKAMTRFFKSDTTLGDFLAENLKDKNIKHKNIINSFYNQAKSMNESLTLKDYYSSRIPYYAYIRHACALFLRSSGLTLKKIAVLIKKNHATVLNSIHQVSHLRYKNIKDPLYKICIYSAMNVVGEVYEEYERFKNEKKMEILQNMLSNYPQFKIILHDSETSFAIESLSDAMFLDMGTITEIKIITK